MINELGKAIRNRREELKITAEELAKKVGIDRTFVSKIENHGLLPSRLVLARIEKALNTTDLFEHYIMQKNPHLEERFVHSFFSIPPVIRKAFHAPEAEELVRRNGGNPSSSVSKATDFLLCGEEPGSKLDKAKALGVKIIDEEDFRGLIKS